MTLHMITLDAAAEDPARVEIGPVFTRAEARADRIARARRHASDCVLLAVVTSPQLSADLIDRAIEHFRDADGAAG